MNTKNVSLNDKVIEKPHILYDLCRKELKIFKNRCIFKNIIAVIW